MPKCMRQEYEYPPRSIYGMSVVKGGRISLPFQDIKNIEAEENGLRISLLNKYIEDNSQATVIYGDTDSLIKK